MLGLKIFDGENKKNIPPEIQSQLEQEVPARTYVLYAGRTVIGWAQILANETGHYELAYVEIKPEYRGQGYGRDFVRFVLSEHFAQQIYCLTLKPEFFLKLGFTLEKKYPPFVDHRDPVCQACDPARCTALVFRKPSDLVRFGAEQKYLRQYENLLAGQNFLGSEFSTVNEKTWTFAENIYFLNIDGYLFLAAYPFFAEPFGVLCPYRTIPDSTLDKFWARLQELGIRRLTYLGGRTLHILQNYSGKNTWPISLDRDNFDYLYKVRDFAEYPGARFANKRNRLKKFLRSHSGGTVINYAPEHRDLFFNFARQRLAEMGVDVISEEVLRLGLEQNLYSGFLVKVGQAEVGLLLYSELNPKTVIVHFELIDERYDGVAQFMNNYLALRLLGTYDFINREQDLGLPGLRKSKLSYNPYRLIKKYTVKF
ncbi:hypothetical protein NO2_0517 [Candidatus Termititenax persephonae]|uniref:N-acetyltransferase domain-containing protein n=1 Tax=Candidatus Termititenax persephonae TaxID=2218525 RepID=A0A388TG83_9BACT|nr:hypothetical protein NO2_0517 [Candidatus Termititenax persephonae]